MGLLCFLDLTGYFLFHVGEIFNYNLFKIFLILFLFLFFFWDQRSLILSSTIFLFFFFLTLFCSSEVITNILSSSSLIHSASDVLLLIPSRVFLISVIVLFASVCLFFNYFRSLLIDSCIFSILFSRCLIIFTVIILNSLSGNFPISSSFIWTSVFLVCSFICAVFLCLFIKKKKNTVFEVSFSQASRKVEFFPGRRLNSLFPPMASALLWLIQWFVMSFV